MLQYMLAISLREKVRDNLNILGVNLPQWGISTKPDARNVRRLRVSGHFIDVDQIAELINTGTINHVHLDGLGFGLNNYEAPSFYSQIFRTGDIEARVFGADQVVINVRTAEILGDRHPDYGPVPFSYFDAVMENTNASPVFFGQLEDNEYCARLKQRYARAEFFPSQGALRDFETLRRSSEISVAVSTFSWLAAWLSSARTIHYPVSGILNPLQRPDIDLLPLRDPRYQFYGFPVSAWRATTENLSRVWDSPPPSRVNRSDLDAMIQKVRPVRSRQLRIKRAKIAARAHIQSLLERLSVRSSDRPLARR